MAGAIMEKVWGLFGMDPAEERDDEELENYDDEELENYDDEEEEQQEERRLWGRRNNKVVSMPRKNAGIVLQNFTAAGVAPQIPGISTGKSQILMR